MASSSLSFARAIAAPTIKTQQQKQQLRKSALSSSSKKISFSTSASIPIHIEYCEK
jgi:hypothetical protein